MHDGPEEAGDEAGKDDRRVRQPLAGQAQPAEVVAHQALAKNRGELNEPDDQDCCAQQQQEPPRSINLLKLGSTARVLHEIGSIPAGGRRV